MHGTACEGLEARNTKQTQFLLALLSKCSVIEPPKVRRSLGTAAGGVDLREPSSRYAHQWYGQTSALRPTHEPRALRFQACTRSAASCLQPDALVEQTRAPRCRHLDSGGNVKHKQTRFSNSSDSEPGTCCRKHAACDSCLG